MLNKNIINNSNFNDIKHSDLNTINIWLVQNKDFVFKVSLNNFFEYSIYYFNQLNQKIYPHNNLKEKGHIHSSLNNILNEKLMDEFLKTQLVVFILTSMTALTFLLFISNTFDFIQSIFSGLFICILGSFFVNSQYKKIVLLLLQEVIEFRLRLQEVEPLKSSK